MSNIEKIKMKAICSVCGREIPEGEVCNYQDGIFHCYDCMTEEMHADYERREKELREYLFPNRSDPLGGRDQWVN